MSEMSEEEWTFLDPPVQCTAQDWVKLEFLAGHGTPPSSPVPVTSSVSQWVRSNYLHEAMMREIRDAGSNA